MNYSVKSLPTFDKNLKYLAKKYPSLKTEFIDLVKILKENPLEGKALGNNCYKIRIAIASKGKGKSGGARIITNFVISADTIYLLTIYDKADKKNLTDKELKELLIEVPA